MPEILNLTTDGGHSHLVERANALTSRRTILGIAGAPGAGKSTLSTALAYALAEEIAVVGMDGFHLMNDELVRLGRRDRKGAPDTFDTHGYIALLTRLKNEPGDIYAPAYQRGIGHSISGAIRIPATTRLVLTEGNYLLVDQEPWAGVRDLLDECWYVQVREEVRIDRLVARHIDSGKTPEAAQEWALGPDQRNAELVKKTRERADLIITLP